MLGDRFLGESRIYALPTTSVINRSLWVFPQYKSSTTKIIGPLNERAEHFGKSAPKYEDRDEIPLEERYVNASEFVTGTAGKIVNFMSFVKYIEWVDLQKHIQNVHYLYSVGHRICFGEKDTYFMRMLPSFTDCLTEVPTREKAKS